jgi:catechol 2,3-dioxygenase-like lactoylglutathione lyase family enzyme
MTKLQARHFGGFHHIDLNVSDLGAAKPVYGLVLEYLGYKMVKDDERGCEWDLECDHGRVSLGLRPARSKDRSHVHLRYAPGLHHMAWHAASREQVDALHRQLIAAGVPILDAPAHYPEYSPTYYAVFFEDPDGMKLEVLHED